MREQIRAEYISRLISGLSKIGPGAMFERFGGNFMDHYLGEPLIHRGLNVQMNPVGNTTDSYNEAGTLVSEYSIDQDYFEGSMFKASSDIVHVLQEHPHVRDIYLLSSQTAPTGKITAFKNRVADWPGMLDKTVYVYDARRLAEIIIDELIPSERAIDDLTEQLPALTHIIDDNAATLSVPGLPEGHLSRPDMVSEIEATFAGGAKVVTLSGISGLGKTRTANEYALVHRNQYDTTIWVDGKDLRKVEDAKAIPMWRGGDSRNVAALLMSRPCLLVVDDADPNLDVSGFAQYCREGSHILVTRRTISTGDIQQPMMSEAMARDMLNREVSVPCPDDIFDLFMKSVGAHPLSLTLINRAIVSSDLSWSDIAEDVASIPELVYGDTRLADLLLGRLEQTLSSELEVFQWAGCGTVDLRFLTHVLGAIRARKLKGFGLTIGDRPGTVKLHDIVFASVVTKNWLSAARSVELDDQLEQFVEKLMATEGLSIRILASTMKWKLVELSKAKPRPAFMVALLEVWRPAETDPSLLFDPIPAVEALAAKAVPATGVEVRSVLESIEGLYRFEKDASFDQARANLAQRLAAFDGLLALPGLSDRSKSEIMHHHAKALKILGQKPEAQKMFEAVVQGPNPLPAARLQLMRLYASGDVEKAFEQADAIFVQAETVGTVSSNIILATFKDLPAVLRERILDRHADLVEREIVSGAEADADDTFPALAAAARHWAWNDRSRLMRIFDVITLTAPTALEDRARAACGELLGAIATGPDGVDPEFQRRGLEYFEAVEKPEPFGLQQHGRLLIEMGRFPEAEALLLQVQDTSPFANYWLSRAKFGNGDVGAARSLIDAALAALTDQRHQRFRSMFLAHRFEVRAAAGDPQAREDLLEAQATCEDPRYKHEIDRRVAETE